MFADLALTAGLLLGQIAGGEGLPDDAQLEREGAVVGAITIVNHDVFDTDDPAENNKIFRLANRLHLDTREAVIRRQLLFASGQPYSRRLLDETERFLRRNRYLYDADIHPVRYENGQVDVVVETRDVWTLVVGAGLSRSGGVNESRFELQDKNFLGYGKDLTLEYREDVDRTTTITRYFDAEFLGSRWEFEALYEDLSDGSRQKYKIARPFFALDERFSRGVTVILDDREDRIYALGKIRDRYRHQGDFLQIHNGWSKGLVGGFVHRWTVGYTYQRDLFSEVPEQPPVTALPKDRELSYPWLSFESVQDDFLETKDLDSISRTEDLLRGRRWGFKLGYSSPSWGGGEVDQAIYDVHVADGWETAHGGLLLFRAGVDGRAAEGRAENLVAATTLRFYQRNFGRHAFVARFEGQLGSNLDVDNQLLLGGDTGLRGYPLRYAEGDRRLLLSLEQRFYGEKQWFRLAYVGAAFFGDIGRAWYQGVEESYGWLRDVGFGLRISSSRSSGAGMIHLDIAFPLDGDVSIEKVQYLARVQETF